MVNINTSLDLGCGQSLITNALKRLVDQLEKKILQIDQSKIVLKQFVVSLMHTRNLMKIEIVNYS